MAEIIVDTSSRDFPVDSKQEGISVGAEEVNSSPEPQLSNSVLNPESEPVTIPTDGPEDGEVNDGDVGIMSQGHESKSYKHKPDDHVTAHILPYKIGKPFTVTDVQHPIYPSNDIFENVRTHLKCQELFTKNINALITQYLLNKQDLERTREGLSESQSNLRRTRREKEKLQTELDQTTEKLRTTEDELNSTKASLDSAVQGLSKTVKKLEKAKEDLKAANDKLKTARPDLIDIKKRGSDLDIDLNFAKERIRNLEEELRRANYGENVANDRNTELTALLFKAQSEKADIERRKDQLGADLRELQRQVNERKRN